MKHIYAAVDCGDVVNPDAATAQVEGGIIFDLSARQSVAEITIARQARGKKAFHKGRVIHLA